MTNVGEVVLLGNELALRRRVDTIAHNVANANTTAFKRQQSQFATHLREMPAVKAIDRENVYQVLDYGVRHDTSEGAFQRTGNPLDVMIGGQGLFQVELPSGQVAYTRVGTIQMAPNGDLEIGGNKLRDVEGRILTVPPEQGATLSIATDGTIVAGGNILGRIAVFQADPTNHIPSGNGLFDLPGAQQIPAGQVRLIAGGLEASNVQTIIETTNLIEATRSYQTSQKMSEGIADLRKRSIERLGRTQF